jgi:hypothetical protein
VAQPNRGDEQKRRSRRLLGGEQSTPRRPSPPAVRARMDESQRRVAQPSDTDPLVSGAGRCCRPATARPAVGVCRPTQPVYGVARRITGLGRRSPATLMLAASAGISSSTAARTRLATSDRAAGSPGLRVASIRPTVWTPHANPRDNRKRIGAERGNRRPASLGVAECAVHCRAQTYGLGPRSESLGPSASDFAN